MSLLGNGGNCVPESAFQECKRDIEREIASAKVREDAYAEMYNNLLKVVSNKFFYNISDNETNRAMAAMIGASCIEAEQWVKKVNELIEEQELEQEK